MRFCDGAGGPFITISGTVPRSSRSYRDERVFVCSWTLACGRGFSGQGVVLPVLLTGFNRFGLSGVTFLVSWVCISVPFCAPTCMFSTKGKLPTKKSRGL